MAGSTYGKGTPWEQLQRGRKRERVIFSVSWEVNEEYTLFFLFNFFLVTYFFFVFSFSRLDGATLLAFLSLTSILKTLAKTRFYVGVSGWVKMKEIRSLRSSSSQHNFFIGEITVDLLVQVIEFLVLVLLRVRLVATIFFFFCFFVARKYFL